jgi:peptidoglycan/xylan/chitin deacetylase (PgdA/CDA1 family)
MSGRAVRWLLSLGHRRTPATRPPRLVIVRHHRIYRDDERPLYRLGVREGVFRAQLEWLVRSGLTPVTVAEGLARLDEGGSGRWVAMSFDDGYADNVRLALPALTRHGGRATFYLTAGLMDERRAPWWDELAHLLERTRSPRLAWSAGETAVDLPLEGWEAKAGALAAIVPLLRVPPVEQSRRLADLADRLGVAEPAPCELATWNEAERFAETGMEVGAHTLTHPFLSLLDASDQEREIAGSIRTIAERLGVRPVGLAYPGGDHDARTIAASRSARLAYAVTTQAGDVASGSPRFELRRRGLSEGACLGPGGRFSERLAGAELDGAFDALRGRAAGRAEEVAA